MAGQDVSRWADSAMFRSEPHNAAAGPRVTLLAGPADPLGGVAACAKMYVGEVVRDLRDVTDDERRRYLAEIQKTKLAMPLESISLHFMIENVTRAFTHQLVRQRTAAYAQESMRFAVVEDMNEAVALPPTLASFNDPAVLADLEHCVSAGLHLTQRQEQFLKWRETVNAISEGYSQMVESGMPAEDARGLMPTNIITRVNYLTNFRGLLDHAGNRLCTNAQQEWRTVFAGIADAMRRYGAERFPGSAWQYEALSQVLRPICYQTGKCAFAADFDRACSIRPRVDAYAAAGVPSSQWGEGRVDLGIPAIRPQEWLSDHTAARVGPGRKFDLYGRRVQA